MASYFVCTTQLQAEVGTSTNIALLGPQVIPLVATDMGAGEEILEVFWLALIHNREEIIKHRWERIGTSKGYAKQNPT
jgi:hypothetical protein